MPPTAPRRAVTPRQAEILELVGAGLGDKEIGRRLGISPNTVRTHLQRVFRDQKVPNRAAAATSWIGEDQAGRLRRRWRTRGLIGLLLVAAATLGAGGALAVAARPVAKLNLQPPMTIASPEPPEPADRPPTSPGAGSGAAVPVAFPTPPPIPTPPTPTAPIRLPQSPAIPVDASRAELTAVNQARTAAGLAPMVWNDCLARVASANAARIAAQDFISLAGGALADTACAAGQPVEIVTYWSSIDDQAVTAILLADPEKKASLLGAHTSFGAAWASGNKASYLVIEIV